MHQLATDDVADLTPTGWAGKQVRSFICPSASDCIALGGDEIKNSEDNYMFPYWVTITDLPRFIHDNNRNDMIKDILGQK